jgi:hypothetical protein
MNRQIHVFASSTFRYMHAERDFGKVNELGYEFGIETHYSIRPV